MFQFSNNTRQYIFKNASALLIKIFKLSVSSKEGIGQYFQLRKKKKNYYNKFLLSWKYAKITFSAPN